MYPALHDIIELFFTVLLELFDFFDFGYRSLYLLRLFLKLVSLMILQSFSFVFDFEVDRFEKVDMFLHHGAFLRV